MPKFIIFVRASEHSEVDVKPDSDMLSTMQIYNDSLRTAGILLQADGLLPSTRDSVRITFNGQKPFTEEPSVEKGPFPAKEMVAGFWIVEVESLDVALEWAKKAPFAMGAVTEVRRIANLKEDY